MIAGTLEVQLQANLARLQQDMTQAKSMVSGAMQSIERSAAMAKSALLGLATGIGVAGLVAMVKASIDTADRLNDLRKSTNITIEDLAGLSLLAKQTGTDLDSLAKGVNKMSVAIGKEPEKFKDLGITAKDAVGQLKQLADIFNLLPDINQRNALAQKIMGKSWQELAPALSEGSKRIGEIIEKGARLSKITAAMAKDADGFNDALAELSLTGAGAMNKMVGPMLSSFTDIVKALQLAYEESGKLKAAWVALGALGQFLFTDDFLSKATKVNREVANLRGGIQLLTERRKGVENSEGPLKKFLPELDLKIREKEVEVKHLLNSLPKAPVDAKPDAAAAAARAKAEKDASDRAARFIKEEKGATDTEKAWASLNKTIGDHSAIQQAELDGREKLTEAQKIALKAMVELRDGRLMGTDAQKKELVVVLQHMLALDEEAATRKKVREAMEEQLKTSEALQQQAEQRQAIIADFNRNNQQTLQDLAAETELLVLDAQLNGAGLLLKQDEIRLTAQVNTQRETAIAMRRIDMDLNRAQQALGNVDSEMRDKEWEDLQRMAELQKTKVAGAIAAREQQKMANDLTRESVSTFNTFWSGVESTGKSVFEHLLGQGTSTMQSIGKAIKASIIDLLYQLTVRKWIINIGTSVAGAFGLGGDTAASGAGGVGGVGGMLSAASGANSLYNLATGSGPIGAGVASYQGVTGAVAAEGAMYAVGGTVAEGALAGISAGLAAVPVWGWAALAAGALLMGSGGGPKQQDLYWNGGNFAADNITSQNPAFYQKVDAYSNQLGASYTPEQLATLNGLRMSAAPGTDENQLFAQVQAQAAQILSQFKSTQQVQAETAAQALADAELAKTRRALEIQLMEAQGNATGALAAKREDEVAALDPTLRAIQNQIYAAQDQAEANAKVAEAAKQAAAAEEEALAKRATVALKRRDLEIQLADLQGNTAQAEAMRREDILASLDESLRPLQQQVFAIIDANAAYEASLKGVADTAGDSVARIADLQRSLASNDDAFQGALRTLPSQLGITALQDARAGQGVSDYLAPIDRAAAARDQLSAAYTSAVGGSLDAVQSFPQLLQQALAINRDVFGSGPEFQKLFTEGNRQLNDLLARQQALQADIIKDVPLTIQQASKDQIAELRKGFGEMVNELSTLRAELRRLTGTG